MDMGKRVDRVVFQTPDQKQMLKLLDVIPEVS